MHATHNRRRLIIALILASCGGASLGPAPNSWALTTIVGDGGDLVAAVSAAADGDVIEIRSNQTFVGSLFWGNKFLTIEAGAGFQPTVKGTPYFDPTFQIGLAAIAGVDGLPGTGGIIRGLRLQPGDNGVLPPGLEHLLPRDFASVILSATGDRSSNMLFENNVFLGQVSLGGTGDYHLDATFADNLFLAPFSIGGTGNLQVEAKLHRNRIEDGVTVSGTGQRTVDLLATDNVIVRTADSLRLDGVTISGISESEATARLVNNTIVGFDVGLRVLSNSSVTAENMLLANAVDLFGISSSHIASSLIADGTFAGVNGNFAGMPSLGPLQQLLPGSIGIDAGNNLAADLQATDIAGLPRIMDGNGDGVARVDVGAFEAVPEPAALLSAGTIAVWISIRRRRRP